MGFLFSYRLKDTQSNNTDEAYTGNTVGRRGNVLPSGNSAPLLNMNADGDGLNLPEASTEKSKKKNGEISEGLPESESVACSKRSIRNLGDPVISSSGGRTNQR